MAKIRKFTVFVTILFLSNTGFFAKTYAQENFYEEQKRVFYGGLVAGANFAQVDGDNFAGYNKIGANIGGIVYAQIKEHIALSIEILYSQKGSKNSQVNVPRTVNYNNKPYEIQTYSINANYAEIPVMINYFDKRKSHFGVGLSYAQSVGITESMTTNPTAPIDLSQYAFKKYDLEMLAGVQLHLVQGLFLNVRFQYSVSPIRTDYPPGFSRSKQFNNLWVVRLMYLLK
jgi:hypothetical protein